MREENGYEWRWRSNWGIAVGVTLPSSLGMILSQSVLLSWLFYKFRSDDTASFSTEFVRAFNILSPLSSIYCGWGIHTFPITELRLYQSISAIQEITVFVYRHIFVVAVAHVTVSDGSWSKADDQATLVSTYCKRESESFSPWAPHQQLCPRPQNPQALYLVHSQTTKKQVSPFVKL